VLTVISFGRSMNVHFDTDSMGSQGLSFGGNQVVTTNTGAVLQVVGVAERFNRPDNAEMLDGECTILFESSYHCRSGQKFPWDKTKQIVCVTEDGRFNGTAE